MSNPASCRHPDEKFPILLLSSGRCGSTLLQRILNTSTEMVMWGEHNAWLRGLARSYHQVATHPLINKNHYERDPSRVDIIKGSLTDYAVPIEWINPFNKEQVTELYRGMIHSMLTRGIDPMRQHWGFKEIRYRQDEPFMPMWMDLFPDTRFIFLVRHPYAVIQSMLLDWRKPTDDELDKRDEMSEYLQWAAKMYNQMNSAIVDWDNDPTIATHIVKYEHLVKQSEPTVAAIFEFLKLPMPENALAPIQVRTGHTSNNPLREKAKKLILSLHEESTFHKILGESALALDYADPAY